MPERRPRLRDSRSWPFDVAICVLGLSLFGWSLTRMHVGDGYVELAVLLGVPLIVLVSRFPMVLDDASGSIEIGFDSSILMFLLCTFSPGKALGVWSCGILATQLTSRKRATAVLFNIGVGILAAGMAAAVLVAVRGPVRGTPRELVAVAAAATVYFVSDYVLSAISVSLDSHTRLGANVGRRGLLLAIGCFVPFDLLGYLGAIVLRNAPWWTVTLLVVPLVTLLVATRAVTRGQENARRLTVLLDAAVRAQTLYESDQVVEALLADTRELLRLPGASLRDAGPADDEIGARVNKGKEPMWVVAPARARARSTTAADQQALDALAAVASDAFARLQLTDDMVHFARHDPLTDLPNRGILQDRASHALQLARRHGSRLALLFVDLDGFKPVNDRFGHAAGDRVLVDVAQRLRECTRASDTVARLGGDEFAVLFEDVDDAQVRSLCERILLSLADGMRVGEHLIPLGASIGVAYGDEHDTTESLLRHADLAMYEAKARGKSQYVEYDDAMGSSRIEKLELIDELRRAVAAGEIVVAYQPVVASDTGRIVGVEALARWCLDGHDIAPDTFIPLAEETGLIMPLGEHVLKRVAADAARLRSAAGRPISMSVNVSVQQLRDPRFIGVVAQAVDAMGTNGLVLEITEREGVADDPLVHEAMERISRLGVRFAIDDFGVGFSSVSYLQDVPAHILKADATLSRNIDRDERACLLLASIAKMGEALGMDVVVEGIERDTQLALVRDQVHAQYAQGYLMHRPMSLDQLAEVVGEIRTVRSEPTTQPTVEPISGSALSGPTLEPA